MRGAIDSLIDLPRLEIHQTNSIVLHRDEKITKYRENDLILDRAETQFESDYASTMLFGALKEIPKYTQALPYHHSRFGHK